MLGGDIVRGEGPGGSWHIGVLAGYGNSQGDTRSNLTHYRARGEVEGYTTGLYGTWYAQGTDEKGLWLDSALQYSWFDNTVSGQDEPNEYYNTQGTTASLEAGYVIPLQQSLRHGVFLQPQAQIVWSGISADDHTEQNGTRVSGDGGSNLRSRLGLKAFMKIHATQDDDTGRRFKPFMETNWIHNTRQYGVTMNGVSVNQSGTRDMAELNVGLEGSLTRRLNVTGSIGQQWGSHRWSDTAASLSVRYRF